MIRTNPRQADFRYRYQESRIWWLLVFLISQLGLFPAWVQAQQQTAPQQQSEPQPVNVFEKVIQEAAQRAQREYQPVEANLPDDIANLSYSKYRAIRFKPERALFREQSDFEVQLFHPGFLYKTPVKVHVLDSDQQLVDVKYQADLFEFGNPVAHLSNNTYQHTGFSGFRVHYPLNTTRYKDELLVFQGASYFRLVGAGQVYGISTRGLAINTGDSGGEEFPFFTEFWIQKPALDATSLTVWALLDSPSVTGAYQFTLKPASSVIVDVEAKLFARKEVAKLGIAPLTSMFYFGENKSRHYDDYRPEVHDSDGLQLRSQQDEWIWRPLNNPKALQITSSMMNNPKGFGLLQRDGSFDHYLDTEARYHKRPGIWIEPLQEWGEGRVELVEIPTDSETNDNIVAYWVSARPFKTGQQRDLHYRITTTNGTPHQHDLAKVIRTRQGWGSFPGADTGEGGPPERSLRQFIVDFKGGDLSRIDSSLPLQAKLQNSSGSVSDLRVSKLKDGSTWRVAFKLAPNKESTVDMRLQLTLRGQPLSEVWNYVWNPNSIQ